MRAPDHTRRVVVTGLGVISPVGNDKATAWANLTNGVSGIREITKFDASAYDQRAAGEVDGFVPSQWMDAKAVRRSETSMHYGVDGLKLPFTIRISSIDSFFSSTRKFTEIKLNVPVDEAKFNKPPAPVGSPSP